MSTSLEENRDSILAERQQLSAQHEFQKKAEAQVGRKMSELIADERWQVYVRHVEAMKEWWGKKVESDRNRLLADVLIGESYIKAKMDHTRSTASLQAYTNALQVVMTLIEKGDAATAELKNSMVKDEV